MYDLVGPKKVPHLSPDWNTITVTCKGPHITAAVNGETVAELNCDEWTTPGHCPDGSKNKFSRAIKDFPRRGYIGFQDHGHKVWFKNVKIRELAEKVEQVRSREPMREDGLGGSRACHERLLHGGARFWRIRGLAARISERAALGRLVFLPSGFLPVELAGPELNTSVPVSLPMTWDAVLFGVSTGLTFSPAIQVGRRMSDNEVFRAQPGQDLGLDAVITAHLDGHHFAARRYRTT